MSLNTNTLETVPCEGQTQTSEDFRKRTTGRTPKFQRGLNLSAFHRNIFYVPLYLEASQAAGHFTLDTSLSPMFKHFYK